MPANSSTPDAPRASPWQIRGQTATASIPACDVEPCEARYRYRDERWPHNPPVQFESEPRTHTRPAIPASVTRSTSAGNSRRAAESRANVDGFGTRCRVQEQSRSASADSRAAGARPWLREARLRVPAAFTRAANQPCNSFPERRSVSGEILETILRLRPLNTMPNQRRPRPRPASLAMSTGRQPSRA